MFVKGERAERDGVVYVVDRTEDHKVFVEGSDVGVDECQYHRLRKEPVPPSENDVVDLSWYTPPLPNYKDWAAAFYRLRPHSEYDMFSDLRFTPEELEGHRPCDSAIFPHLRHVPLPPYTPELLEQGVEVEVKWNCVMCGLEKARLLLKQGTCQVLSPHCSTFSKVFKVELNVPSGVVVYDNDLRDLCGIETGFDEFDINGMVGKRDTTEAFAKLGMVHIYVGNSDPSIYRRGFKREAFDIVNKSSDRAIGYIMTQLWWVSLMDQDEAQHRVDALNRLLPHSPPRTLKEKQSFKVKPGVYSFEYDAASLGMWGKVDIKARWVRPPDPINRINPIPVSPRNRLNERADYRSYGFNRGGIYKDWGKLILNPKVQDWTPLRTPPEFGDVFTGHRPSIYEVDVSSPHWLRAAICCVWQDVSYGRCEPWAFTDLTDVLARARPEVLQEAGDDLTPFLEWMENKKAFDRWCESRKADRKRRKEI